MGRAGWLVSADLPEEGALALPAGGGGGWLNGWGTHCTVLAPDNTVWSVLQGAFRHRAVLCRVHMCSTVHITTQLKSNIAHHVGPGRPVRRSTWATRGYITVACLPDRGRVVCRRACLLVRSVLSVFLSCGRDRPPLPTTSTVCPPLVLLLPQSWSLSLSGLGCSPGPFPIILDCISLTPSSSPSSHPRLLSPMRQSSNTFETDPGKRRHTLSNSPPSSQAFSRPTTTEVTLLPGSVHQLALVFLQSCHLLRSG